MISSVRMRAALRYLHSPDIPDLASFQPTEADNFGFLLQILVGPQEGVGEESFDVMVCTPRWLIENHSPEDILAGRHMLIMFQYDYRRLERFIQARITTVSGESWQDIANQLARLAHWEFEGYRAQ